MDGQHASLEALSEFLQRCAAPSSAFLIDIDAAKSLSFLGKEESENQSLEQQDFLRKMYLETKSLRQHTESAEVESIVASIACDA